MFSSLVLGVGRVAADTCHYDGGQGAIVCTSSGSEHSGGGRGSSGGSGILVGTRPPLRYVYTSTDPVVGDCHYWSRRPGGIDAWDAANDPTVIRIVNTTPVCPRRSSAPAPAPVTVAWEVFRSFTLARPLPSLQPPAAGITGLPTFLATTDPADVTHTERLPDGRMLEVRASVASLVVDWGDGTRTNYRPERALAYPAGNVTHTYTTKTCDAAYRQGSPIGANCHPTLAAYPITATFSWIGRYRIGGGWIDLGTLNRSATVAYDVDEVQGVLQP